MRKYLLLLACAVLLGACSTLTREEKVARAALQAQKVQAALDAMKFCVEIDYMYPMRGAGRRVDYGFDLRVQGDSVYSYLPYFGRAYNIPYGGGKGLNFSAPITDKRITMLKPDLRRIELYVVNEEDTYLYTLDVYDTGSTSLTVQMRERDRISYSGTLVTEE